MESARGKNIRENAVEKFTLFFLLFSLKNSEENIREK